MARRIRIISGLVLFVFVTIHLLNVALGLHSIALMDRARPVLMGLWTNPLGTTVLASSMIAHAVLGLVAIYQRNTLRLSPSDSVQLLASLAIVPLLTPHVVGTVVAARFGVVPSFALLIPYFWIDQPQEGLRQVLLLAFLWVHGCVGVYTWARIQPWWPRIGGFLYPLAVAVPVLGLLGFVEAGNQAIAYFDNPAAFPGAVPPLEAPVLTLPFDEILALLKRINWTVFILYLILLAAVFAARQFRVAGSHGRARVTLAGGPVMTGSTSLNLLEIARLNHTPMANLCRGRGRCGTCRVRVLATTEKLPERTEAEEKTLARLAAPPDVRLACQLKPPAGDMTVERVLSPFLRPRDMHDHDAEAADGPHHGEPSTA
ncbi:2Fe-2S iron-sulfur cluster binding domain-containing protein [Nitratireductor sp. CAU 1489]|uniref:2Fe-2S iron-sulfur cluster binding domain-containing protein n=1 Tax=Nitratireductor arenosus TaxID=2682096 RepID=A0A844QJF9_9HYPH|nr:2Fe-2S iron-sulfur cluster-binding protein [Nitratireductor arenosus]MVA99347.1 2Fe-2S iron-sulfur cluster binding domain-containing protein [Nitratireductor arenosus]